jgi:hypothetical protein
MSTNKFERVFVVGAYLPNGGTFMAYHLGRLLQREFGLTAIAVQTAAETADNGIQDYDLRMPSISIAEMELQITARDILIVNPSFSSHRFGARLPGFKICYVQGFTTFTLLDLNFDCYVAVSDFVRNFLSAVYGLDVDVIPPFIDFDAFPPAPAWHDRPATDVLCYGKGDAEIWNLSFDRLREIVQARAPHVCLSEPLAAHGRPRRELLSVIGKYRYFLTLSAAEGFGLVPLEAMAMGATVVGYDGFGGRHYMRDGQNCAVAAYPQIDQVADKLIDLVERPNHALRLAEAGRETAAAYSYDRFRNDWISRFARALGITAHSR